MKTRTVINIVAGTGVLLFAGIIYAWSILSAPIAEEFSDLSQGALSLTFTLCMSMFCLGGLVAGFLADKWSILVRMLLSAALFGFGFWMTARMQGLPGLYLGYGVLCGLGAGFAYNTVMVSVPKWLPDRPALVSGILLMGFGASSLILGTVFARLTPALSGGWRSSYQLITVVLAAVMVVGGFVICTPEPESSAQTNSYDNPTDVTRDYEPGAMLRTTSFWLFFLWVILVSAAGLAMISQAKPVASSIDSTLGVGTLALIAGLISVFNGLGRILFGYLYDRILWKKTLFLVTLCCLAGGVVLLGAFLLHSMILLVLGFIVLGISYGGAPTMCAAVIRDFYGSRHYSINFQIALLNLLPASFAGTLSGILYDHAGSYLSTLLMLLLCGLIALPLLRGIRKP